MLGRLKQRLLLWVLEREVNKMPKSWRTSIAGVALWFATVGNAIFALVDADPTTNPDWKIVAAGFVAGWGLIQARDQKAHEAEKTNGRR